MDHNPAPWRVGKHGSVVCDTPVPDIDGSDATEYYGGHLIAESITPSNARRIVACANFCEGVPTEILEKGVIGTLEDEAMRRSM